VVQHITAGFLPGLVQWLSNCTEIKVRIAEDGEKPMPGNAYLAPDGYHMGIKENQDIVLSAAAPENGLRPAVSFLFRTVAEILGARAAGVLMTGMGKDGAQELRLMHDRGAITMAQDAESSVIHGMPGEAIALGAADYILPPARIASTLASLLCKN
jgi:two-component system chemotaxis response regulator CheB